MVLISVLAVVLAIGMLLLIVRFFRFTTPSRRLWTVLFLVVVFGGGYVTAFLTAEHSLPSGWTWKPLSWRARLIARKMEGDVPDLSWLELFFMARIRGGFALEGFVDQGLSLEGAVKNAFDTTEDYHNGERIFRERCSMCHGKEASGGMAPALNHSILKHGDSDLAMYKVARDGIPRTGMAPVELSIEQRWQVIGYIRALQFAAASRYGRFVNAGKANTQPKEDGSKFIPSIRYALFVGVLDR